MPDAILRLDDIHVHFPVKRNWRGKARAWAHALNGVDLAVRRGETLGVVGESGCGKTTLAQVLMGLQHPTQGQIRWNNDRGQPNVQIVFQDPQSSLDPRLPGKSLPSRSTLRAGRPSRLCGRGLHDWPNKWVCRRTI